MSVCAKFQLSSWSRSSWKVCVWCVVVSSKWLLCLTSTLVALELLWVELSYVGFWQLSNIINHCRVLTNIFWGWPILCSSLWIMREWIQIYSLKSGQVHQRSSVQIVRISSRKIRAKIGLYISSTKNASKVSVNLIAMVHCAVYPAHPVTQGFSSFLSKPYIEAVTHFWEVEWWRTLMVECVTSFWLFDPTSDFVLQIQAVPNNYWPMH